MLAACPQNPSKSSKGAITSKIKYAIKLKTSPARLAELLQPSLAFCFSLQPMMAHWMVRSHWLRAKPKSYNSNVFVLLFNSAAVNPKSVLPMTAHHPVCHHWLQAKTKH